MSIVKSGNFSHDSACAVAEGSRQVSVAAAGSSQSAVRTAEIAFHRAVIASAKANGMPIPTTSIFALRELGTGGA
jgi:hypothetical protein